MAGTKARTALLSWLWLVGGVASATETPSAIAWQPWSEAVFERAAREDRFVLLDLEAVWCHWCHVMDETTYRDPEVVRLMRERFVPVRVDQDARPDLSNRYEDYGWPATVVFDGAGNEIVKFQGYISPARMRSLLQGIIDDPSPGPSVTLKGGSAPPPRTSGSLPTPLVAELESLFFSRYDEKAGGFGFSHKFLDWDSVEYALRRARDGDARAEAMAVETLRLQQKLLDPVWGGVYQYSDSGDWDHPHFEKIMAMQAENLRVYALAFAAYQKPEYLRSAREIARFLTTLLMSPEGAFYTSQDADVVAGQHSAEYFALGDAERRRRGMPRIDRHVYARENGWAIAALAEGYGSTGEASFLDAARRAALWVLAHRALEGGGFRHDAADTAGPYIGDSVAMGRAFLALHAATGEREWLAHAEAAARFIDRTFRVAGERGFVTAKPSGRFDKVVPQRDENIAVARLATRLARYTGEVSFQEMAREAMAYLGIPEVAQRFNTGGVLLAQLEIDGEPLHVTVVGPRDAEATRGLHRAALALSEPFKRVEILDRRDGPPRNPDVSYPDLKRPAAFLCSDGKCSSPAYTPEELAAKAARVRR